MADILKDATPPQVGVVRTLRNAHYELKNMSNLPQGNIGIETVTPSGRTTIMVVGRDGVIRRPVLSDLTTERN
jgi:hypothetical protein